MVKPAKVHLASSIDKTATPAVRPARRHRSGTYVSHCGVFRTTRLVTSDRRKVTCTMCLRTTRPRGRKPRAVKAATYAELRAALRAIYTAVRGDEKGEFWTLRRYLDKRNVFNDDLGKTERLIEAVCKTALHIP